MKMSKRIASVISVILLILCVLSVGSASADSSRNVNVYVPYHQRYSLITIVDEEKQPMGVRITGTYFGSGEIPVTADIYSSDEFPVDFYINEETSAYSSSQLIQRARILELAERIDSIIEKVDKYANTQYSGEGGLPVSDIYRYNVLPYGTKIAVNKVTYDMLAIAKEMYGVTNGAYNPAVYRLVDLWGFSSRIWSYGNFNQPYDRKVTSDEFFNNGYPLPDQKYVEAFSSPDFIDFSDSAVTLSQEGDSFYVTKNVRPAQVDGESYEQWLDLGGIAKGYAVDCIRDELSALGITRYNVDAGTSSLALGKYYDGGKTKMGISDPFRYGKNLVSTDVDVSSVSTSGQYIRKYTVNGVEYSHIIDGSKGAPAQTGIKLVTVIAPEGSVWAAKGDCLTTALTVMGHDKIAEFCNGYLKDNGIQVVVVYQSVDGNKEIISNMSASELTKESDSYDDYSWAVSTDENGKYIYSPNVSKREKLTWLIITLGVLVCAAVIAIVVYHFVKGRHGAIANLQYARREKPFKICDVGIYLAVLLVIIVLFSVFLGGKTDEKYTVVKVIDMQTQETLFAYNVSRDECTVNADSGEWTVEVERLESIYVTLRKTVNGEERFNVVKINFDGKIGVKMDNSKCGFHQDCVRNFPEITYKGGTIVCSPNRLKVVTE